MNSSTDTLTLWREREAQLAGLHAPVGVARADQLVGRSGLQTFEAMLAGTLPRAPIAEALDFNLVEAAAGHVEFQGRPLARHYNPMGGVHGGWMATLLDSAVSVRVVDAVKLVIFGSNLGDAYYIGDDFSSQDAGNAGTPRRVGVQVTYQF